MGHPDKTATCVQSAARRRWLGRIALAIGAVVLLFSWVLPYWKMRLVAPQYPKGLTLVVFLNRIEGDVQEFDTLNHYIGMRALTHGATTERRLAIPALLLTVLGLAVTALVPRWWAALFALPALFLPLLFAGDLYWWMRDYGLNLDPKAPLSHAVKPFIPPILGAGKIAQFQVTSGFEMGFMLAVLAGILVAIGLWLTWRTRQSGRSVTPALLLCVLLVGSSESAHAATWVVEPGSSMTTIDQALATAQDGDRIIVRGGIHRGPFVITKSVALMGEGAPVLDGGGSGTVIRLTAPESVLSGFTIRHSGDVLSREDAGLVVSAAHVVVEGNQFEDVLFGVSFRLAPHGVLRKNTLRGKPLPVPRRGDLIRVWYSDGVVIEENRLSDGRDAVLWFSKRLRIQHNDVRQARYGLHFMYCDDALVQDNILSENSVGIYLMYSTRLQLRGNRMVRSHGPSGYGLGLKDMEETTVEENIIADNRVGVFLEHATGTFARNLIGYNDTAVRLLPTATQNVFAGNSFQENGEQVTTDGASDLTRNTWEGNFWSDYRGFDANGDGIGDVPYRAMRLFEQLTDRYPAFRLYAGSPAAQAVDFAAALFPLFAPQPKFVDAHPRMGPGVWK